ncbi:MAG: hypothetical protein C0179_03610 [Fervidicoccus sp.]|nr:MAG: hypothetical protein C0179_03610 [Fervidicoccus sp.]
MFGMAGFINSIKLAVDLVNSFLSTSGINLSIRYMNVGGEEDNTIDIVLVLRLSCSDKAVCEALRNTLKNQSEASEEESELEDEESEEETTEME